MNGRVSLAEKLSLIEVMFYPVYFIISGMLPVSASKFLIWDIRKNSFRKYWKILFYIHRLTLNCKEWHDFFLQENKKVFKKLFL